MLPKEQQLELIPSPLSIHSGKEPVIFDDSMPICYGEGLEMEAGYLCQRLKELTGQDFKQIKGIPARLPAISLQTGAYRLKKSEAYELTINSKTGMAIQGFDAAGVFYGIQSFLATLPVNQLNAQEKIIKTSSLQITDQPRFSYRGL